MAARFHVRLISDGADQGPRTVRSQITGDPTGSYCHWDPIGVTFAGTAKSVDVGGTATFIALDNVTLGASAPSGAVPKPATWAMMPVGFGAMGGGLRRRQKVAARIRFA